MKRRFCLALLLWPAAVFAQCTVSAVGVSFGNYDPFSEVNRDGTGRVSITCHAPTSYSVGLGPGQGSYLARSMASGPHLLAYNLYIDATRTTVWGDGTASTAVVQGSGSQSTHTIYGRIPARQNPYAGIYTDTITVVVSF